jgi:Ni,Fe-hydrogenase I cytochrome b subunit
MWLIMIAMGFRKVQNQTRELTFMVYVPSLFWKEGVLQRIFWYLFLIIRVMSENDRGRGQ